jgi:hypothetical protein
MMLLSDGTVMVEGGGQTTTWYKLTPNASGSYASGTWTTLTSMHFSRLYFGSNVLPDGRVFLVGGEYSSAGSFTRTGEIYNPVSNSWSDIANFPQSNFGDDPTMVLPDGRILGGYLSGPQTYIYNPATNAWTATGSKLRNDRSDEETWVKLRDNSILSYDIFNLGHAQRYVPSSGTWADAGAAPNNLSSGAVGSELGPATVLPDGRVFYAGATGHTAFYNPGTNSWAAGTDIPGGLGADDAPGVLMPNGHILLAVDTPVFHGPTHVYEFDPTAAGGAGSYTEVTPSISGLSTGGACFTDRMLMLPNGQVLYTTGGNKLAVFTPTEAPSASWRSAVSNISNSGGTFTLTGTLLNGINGGASYGDDAEMDSNYPLVRLTDASNAVKYARTTNWSSTSIFAPGSTTPETVQFALPSGTNPGAYLLNTVANGIASPSVLTVLMSSTTNNITIRVNPSSSTQVQVLQGSSVLGSFNASAFSSVLVVGDASTDTVTIDYSNGNPLPAGGFRFQAGSGTATLNVNDQATTAAQTYTVGAGSVIRSGTTLAYAGIRSLNVNGGRGNNTYTITGSTAPGGTVVNAGTGANTVNLLDLAAGNPLTINTASGTGANILLGDNLSLGGILAPVTVTASTADILGFTDQNTTTARTFTFNSSSITWTGGPTVNYSGVSQLELSAGSGNNTFNINGISASAFLYLNGGPGNNTLVGPNAPDDFWDLTGANQGFLYGSATVNGVGFLGMSSLTTGTGTDYFVVEDGASLGGNLTGRGIDSLDYTPYTTSVIVDLLTGVATGIGGTLSGFGAVAGGSGSAGTPGLYNLLIGNGFAYLAGGTGRRNILVGGANPSTLVGGDGEDLLIGGSTIYDTQAGLANWQAIATYWAGSDPFATRVANLQSGTGVPRLDATTVTGNGGSNSFAGNGGVALVYTDGLDSLSGFASTTLVSINP